MAKVENPAKPLARVDFLHRADRQYEIVVCMMPDPSVLVGQKDARAVVALPPAEIKGKGRTVRFMVPKK